MTKADKEQLKRLIRKGVADSELSRFVSASQKTIKRYRKALSITLSIRQSNAPRQPEPASGDRLHADVGRLGDDA